VVSSGWKPFSMQLSRIAHAVERKAILAQKTTKTDD